MTIYIEILNNIPTRSTNNIKIVEQLNFQNTITTEYDDYTINNNKYLYQNNKIVLNPNYEEEQRKANRRIEILQKLDEIDRICIRALRAGEQDRISTYEVECEQLREELRNL